MGSCKLMQALRSKWSQLEDQAHVKQSEAATPAKLQQELACKAAQIHSMQVEQLSLRQELSEKDAGLQKAQSIQAGAAFALTQERAQFER